MSWNYDSHQMHLLLAMNKVPALYVSKLPASEIHFCMNQAFTIIKTILCQGTAACIVGPVQHKPTVTKDPSNKFLALPGPLYSLLQTFPHVVWDMCNIN